jgi:excisionase family DNA binding protein
MRPQLNPSDATSEDTLGRSLRRSPMDVKEASLYLGVEVRFVRRLIAEKRIEYYKVGRLVRISPDELDRYLDSCRVLARPTSH